LFVCTKPENKMKNKTYHIVVNSIREITERDNINTPNTQTHE